MHDSTQFSSILNARLLARLLAPCYSAVWRATGKTVRHSAECTSYAHEVCEMALAHSIGNKAEAAYRRGDLFDKRRRFMAEWAAYCANESVLGKTVTPIRTAAGLNI